jgi:hypothetical protein
MFMNTGKSAWPTPLVEKGFYRPMSVYFAAGNGVSVFLYPRPAPDQRFFVEICIGFKKRFRLHAFANSRCTRFYSDSLFYRLPTGG